MRVGLCIAGCCALLAVISPAKAAEKFTRKYTEQSKLVKETETKTDQTLKIAGMAVETKATSFTVATTVAGKRDAEGNLSLEETVNVLQVDLQLPGGLSLQFDSGNPDKAADNSALEPLLELLRATFKNPITTVVDRDNHVQEVKIANDAAEKLPKEVKGLLDPAVRKKAAEQHWSFLPDGPVSPGDQWERLEDHNIGGGQNLSYKTRYTYVGPEEKDGKTYHKFGKQHLEVSYSLDPNANPLVKIPNSELKVDKSTGTILYLPETGAVALRESEDKITGKLTLVVNGQELPSELDLTISEKTTLQK